MNASQAVLSWKWMSGMVIVAKCSNRLVEFVVHQRLVVHCACRLELFRLLQVESRLIKSRVAEVEFVERSLVLIGTIALLGLGAKLELALGSVLALLLLFCLLALFATLLGLRLLLFATLLLLLALLCLLLRLLFFFLLLRLLLALLLLLLALLALLACFLLSLSNLMQVKNILVSDLVFLSFLCLINSMDLVVSFLFSGFLLFIHVFAIVRVFSCSGPGNIPVEQGELVPESVHDLSVSMTDLFSVVAFRLVCIELLFLGLSLWVLTWNFLLRFGLVMLGKLLIVGWFARLLEEVGIEGLSVHVLAVDQSVAESGFYVLIRRMLLRLVHKLKRSVLPVLGLLLLLSFHLFGLLLHLEGLRVDLEALLEPSAKSRVRLRICDRLGPLGCLRLKLPRHRSLHLAKPNFRERVQLALGDDSCVGNHPSLANIVGHRDLRWTSSLFRLLLLRFLLLRRSRLGTAHCFRIGSRHSHWRHHRHLVIW